MAMQQSRQQPRKQTVISEAELAKHNTADDLWVVVHGQVYDLTAFNEHPGGKDVLIKNAGTDATKFFIGHSSQAKRMMKKYHVGRLARDRLFV